MKIIVALFTALVAIASFAVPAKAAPHSAPVQVSAPAAASTSGPQVSAYGFQTAWCQLFPFWC